MFCEKCGNKLQENICVIEKNEASEVIKGCGFIKFYNPIPVSICLIPVLDNGKVFLLGIKRSIEPALGKIALPGGFQEIEPVLSAALREVKEEAGVDLEAMYPNHPELLSSEALVLSVPANNRNLMFFKANVMLNKEDINFDFKSNESLGVFLIDENSELAFPLHKKAVDWFYGK